MYTFEIQKNTIIYFFPIIFRFKKYFHAFNLDTLVGAKVNKAILCKIRPTKLGISHGGRVYYVIIAYYCIPRMRKLIAF